MYTAQRGTNSSIRNYNHFKKSTRFGTTTTSRKSKFNLHYLSTEEEEEKNDHIDQKRNRQVLETKLEVPRPNKFFEYNVLIIIFEELESTSACQHHGLRPDFEPQLGLQRNSCVNEDTRYLSSEHRSKK